MGGGGLRLSQTTPQFVTPDSRIAIKLSTGVARIDSSPREMRARGGGDRRPHFRPGESWRVPPMWRKLDCGPFLPLQRRDVYGDLGQSSTNRGAMLPL
jgi:hypothetical protein